MFRTITKQELTNNSLTTTTIISLDHSRRNTTTKDHQWDKITDSITKNKDLLGQILTKGKLYHTTSNSTINDKHQDSIFKIDQTTPQHFHQHFHQDHMDNHQDNNNLMEQDQNGTNIKETGMKTTI